MDDTAPRYTFGRNWQQYLDEHFSEHRVATARDHMLAFLGLQDLKGRVFLDVGCGSGLHSLAALRAGAERVISFDLDADSVAATRFLREREGGPSEWEVNQGSALDADFLATLPTPDILYSWGVLHHTGSMWEAIEKVSGLMGSETLFYVALYTTTRKTPYWIEVKKRYARATPIERRWMEIRHVLRHRILPDLITLQNPLRKIRDYPRKRGMDYMTDVRDWLGGWPYEDATIAEVLRFARERLDLELVHIATGQANTEYLLKRR